MIRQVVSHTWDQRLQSLSAVLLITRDVTQRPLVANKQTRQYRPHPGTSRSTCWARSTGRRSWQAVVFLIDPRRLSSPLYTSALTLCRYNHAATAYRNLLLVCENLYSPITDRRKKIKKEKWLNTMNKPRLYSLSATSTRPPSTLLTN